MIPSSKLPIIVTLLAGAIGPLAGKKTLVAAPVDRELAVQINSANQSLRAGDVDAAIAGYDQVAALDSPWAEGSFNRAVALYRKGDVVAAKTLLDHVAADPDDALAAKARYNLGNCHYALALQEADHDPPAAIEGLHRAIANYRSALALDPNDSDARANTERAAKLIQQMQSQQKKKEDEQQKEQQKEEDQQEEDQQQEEKQQPDQNDGAQRPDQQHQDQGETPPEERQQEQKQQPSEQENRSQSSEASGQEGQEGQEEGKESAPQPTEDAGPSADPASESPPDDGKPGDSPSPESLPEDHASAQAQEEASAPTGELTSAEEDNPVAGETPETTSPDDGQEVVPWDPTRDGEMTEEEARKMLQAIRDRDMLRRLRRQAVERRRHIPVDRDW